MICKQLIAAQNIILDSFSSSISAINLHQDIATLFPNALSIMVCTSFLREANETPTPNIVIHLLLNEAMIMPAIPLGLSFGESLYARNILTLGVVPISAPGKLEFKVLYEDRELLKYDISLKDNSGAQAA